MPNNEPTKGISLMRLFKKNQYKIFWINEFRTSIKSFIDGSHMEKFKIRKSIKPESKNTSMLVHGLLRSKNGNNKSILMSRNFNGSMNILQKGRCILERKAIPEYLKRPKKKSLKKFNESSFIESDK